MGTTVGFFPVPGVAIIPPCFPAHTLGLCTLTLPPTGGKPAARSPEQQGARWKAQVRPSWGPGEREQLWLGM